MRNCERCVMVFLLWLQILVAGVNAQDNPEIPPTDNNATGSGLFSVANLPRCENTTGELTNVDRDDTIEPCILFDIDPQVSDDDRNRTTILTVVGVFDCHSGDHRDGAVVAAEKLNEDNGGRGAAIGYYQDHFVKFRLVVAIPGNSKNLPPTEYQAAHQGMLESLLIHLSPQYIMGTASSYAQYEKDLAGKYQTMLLAQVGPQSFYDKGSNDHIFGVHIPSEDYGVPAFQAVRFGADSRESRKEHKLRIVYRDRSEFFYSTCRHVYEKAIEEGFDNTVAIEYNPEADHDNDGIINQEDEDFVRDLADQACSPAEANDGVAIWGCIVTTVETNIFLERLRENGCRPSSMWLTVASWGWSLDYPSSVPYLQSGAQWHQTMAYSDEYFTSGLAMLEHAKERFNHTNLPSYGILGSYHGIYLMYMNVRSFFKGKDSPEVQVAFQNQYEELRRNMLDLSAAKTLYGPTSFDDSRRNIGRGSAGLQWLVPADLETEATDFEMLMVSPIDQATAAVTYPAPSALSCEGGEFVNQTKIATDPALLSGKCNGCPVDTINQEENIDIACQSCTSGSTEGETGSQICIQHEENLIPKGLKGFGLSLMVIVFLLALFFIGWTYHQRSDPVVQLSQPEFLYLICIGSIISSSSIIPLTMQAEAFDDETAASRACTALPWLYTTGWMLQYSCISVKSYRMYVLTNAQKQMKRVELRSGRMFTFVGLLLLANWLILVPWTIVDPLTWQRSQIGTDLDRENGVLTYESLGQCTSENLFYWVGPLLGLQLVTMIVTSYIRNVSDRYQESKHVIMASVYIFEMLIVGT
jgi:hypothetical protein